MTGKTAENAPSIAGILLAAGGSSRMGEPKQLLIYKGKTLLRRAAETLIHSACGPVAVVLGAEIEQSKNEIKDLPVRLAFNENWQAGMSSSIKTGLEYLLQTDPEISAVVITLCDQPNVASSHIDKLAAKFRETKKSIVAARYDNVIGVPALFDRGLFDELLKIKGDKGAREIIAKYSDALTTIPLPEAALDIDTKADLSRLSSDFS
jgi:molybdenum cofactor cytidylyltransferase